MSSYSAADHELHLDMLNAFAYVFCRQQERKLNGINLDFTPQLFAAAAWAGSVLASALLSNYEHITILRD
eukprot:scaffold113394_cov17-Prasinocladus_malaysianus.AAC.2